MKRNIALLLLGILPLPLGYALNFVILSLPSSSILLYAVSIGFLLLWVLLARRVSAREGRPIVQALLLSAFGLLMLLLAFYQELVMGRYWVNLFGASTFWPGSFSLPPGARAAFGRPEANDQNKKHPPHGRSDHREDVFFYLEVTLTAPGPSP